MNNKKIASEIAIGITLLVAVIIGGIFLVQNKEQESADVFGGVLANQGSKPADQKMPAKSDKPFFDGKNEACVGHLYEGEATLRGSYVLTTIPGTDKKEWLLKIAKEDIDKLPVQAKTQTNEVVKNLLFISDATPEMIAKLKKATEDKPEEITIKGFYLDCEGVSVVSIEPAKLALAKYLKK